MRKKLKRMGSIRRGGPLYREGYVNTGRRDVTGGERIGEKI